MNIIHSIRKIIIELNKKFDPIRQRAKIECYNGKNKELVICFIDSRDGNDYCYDYPLPTDKNGIEFLINQLLDYADRLIKDVIGEIETELIPNECKMDDLVTEVKQWGL